MGYVKNNRILGGLMMNVNVTEKAQEELKRILDKKGSNDKSVRIYIAGVG